MVGTHCQNWAPVCRTSIDPEPVQLSASVFALKSPRSNIQPVESPLNPGLVSRFALFFWRHMAHVTLLERQPHVHGVPAGVSQVPFALQKAAGLAVLFEHDAAAHMVDEPG